MATTSTIYVAQNVITLSNVRHNTPRHEAFDTSCGKVVQQLWDNGQTMRALNGGRNFVNKNTVGGDTRICFIDPEYFRFLTNAQHSETGERLDAYQAQPQS